MQVARSVCGQTPMADSQPGVRLTSRPGQLLANSWPLIRRCRACAAVGDASFDCSKIGHVRCNSFQSPCEQWSISVPRPRPTPYRPTSTRCQLFFGNTSCFNMCSPLRASQLISRSVPTPRIGVALQAISAAKNQSRGELIILSSPQASRRAPVFAALYRTETYLYASRGPLGLLISTTWMCTL